MIIDTQYDKQVTIIFKTKNITLTLIADWFLIMQIRRFLVVAVRRRQILVVSALRLLVVPIGHGHGLLVIGHVRRPLLVALVASLSLQLFLEHGVVAVPETALFA